MENILSSKILNVNPHAIIYYSEPPNWWWYNLLDKRIKNSHIKKTLKKYALYKTFYGGDWDVRATFFEKTNWFLQIKDFKDNIKKLESSLWYKLIMKEINLNGFYFHKKTKITNKEELIHFFENYVINLIESLKKNNFISENQNDVPQVLIGRNGQMIKSAHGCHRLAIIKAFKIKCEFPVKIIGIHKKFGFKNKNNLNNFDEIYDHVKLNYTI
tara:strand:+ start:109 stop:750 length:642 start_codon:yes stop_codon:yes gene_type:complete